MFRTTGSMPGGNDGITETHGACSGWENHGPSQFCALTHGVTSIVVVVVVVVVVMVVVVVACLRGPPWLGGTFKLALVKLALVTHDHPEEWQDPSKKWGIQGLWGCM